jgi:hypothetical protein
MVNFSPAESIGQKESIAKGNHVGTAHLPNGASCQKLLAENLLARLNYLWAGLVRIIFFAPCAKTNIYE